MSQKWRGIIPLGILFVLLLLFGCEDAGQKLTPADTVQKPAAVVTDAVNVRYADGVMEVPPEAILTWKAETGELILPNTSMPVAGQYVYTGISNKFPNGALKKIVSVDTKDEGSTGGVRLVTENAAITDIINNGTFTAKGNISLNGDAQLVSPDGSIVFIEDDHESFLFVYNSSADLVRKFAITYDIADKASIRGTAKVELLLDFLLDIRWGKIEMFSVSIKPDILFNVAISGLFDEEYKKYLGTLYFPPIVMGPVILVPSMELFLNTKFEGNLDWGGSFQATLNAGIRYSQKEWTPFANISTDGVLNDLKLSGQTEVSLGPEVALKLYGVTGPYFALQGYVSANGTISTARQSIDFTGLAGARGRLGGKLDMLGKQLADLDYDLFDVHKSITLASVFYKVSPPPVIPSIDGSFSYRPIGIAAGDTADRTPLWVNAPPDQMVRYRTAGPLPDGITLDSASGVISVSGTAVAMQEHSFSIVAVGTDGFTGEISGAVSISIAEPAPPPPPVIPSIDGSFSYRPIGIAAGDTAGRTPLWVNAPPDQMVRYRTAGPLPDGITLDSASGVISVSGTAVAMQEHSFSIVAVGTDGFTGEISGAVSISIADPAPPPPPVIPSIDGSFSYRPIGIAAGDTAGRTPLWVNAPPDQMVRYRTAGPLPDGITLDSASGVISVSGTAVAMQEHSFSIVAVGTDGFTGEISGAVSISIADPAPPPPPVIPSIDGSFSYRPIGIAAGDTADRTPLWVNAPPDSDGTLQNRRSSPPTALPSTLPPG